MKKGIFRYRIITNLNCNMNESTGVNGNCYFCYQKFKSPLRLDCDKMEETLKKELIEHCKRQMQRFERMGRTDSFAYKEHAVLLSFLERPYLHF